MDEMIFKAGARCPQCKAQIEMEISGSDRVNNFLIDRVRKITQRNRKAEFSRSMRGWFISALVLNIMAMIIFPYPDVIKWTFGMTCLYGFIYVTIGSFILYSERNHEKKLVNKEIKEMTGEI